MTYKTPKKYKCSNCCKKVSTRSLHESKNGDLVCGHCYRLERSFHRMPLKELEDLK